MSTSEAVGWFWWIDLVGSSGLVHGYQLLCLAGTALCVAFSVPVGTCTEDMFCCHTLHTTSKCAAIIKINNVSPNLVFF